MCSYLHKIFILAKSGCYSSYLHRPQELEVYLHSTRSKHGPQKWLKLIKDYDLEVHYHPRKANVIVDALSRKAHCNYLLAVSLIGEESSIRVPPDLSLFNVTLTPSLRWEIIVAQ
jgi:hypothetical protein